MKHYFSSRSPKSHISVLTKKDVPSPLAHSGATVEKSNHSTTVPPKTIHNIISYLHLCLGEKILLKGTCVTNAPLVHEYPWKTRRSFRENQLQMQNKDLLALTRVNVCSVEEQVTQGNLHAAEG